MPENVARKIQIKGIVQGVGFRPFVYSLAISNNITGWVRNSSKGVEIEINGNEIQVNNFISELTTSPPPLSRIDEFQVKDIETNNYQEFKIVASNSIEGEFIPISPDFSICNDCLRELFNPDDHRFRYPFINCTNCGSRFTIIKDIPYDRPKTTMAEFPMCDYCHDEYMNPLNRRYHAQPVACPNCGPQVSLIVDNTTIASGEDAIQISRKMISEGKILAIKGLGGYHLACDAKNYQSVENLRSRKKRSDKPFALMAFSLNTINEYCLVSESEKIILESKERPIVLLQRRNLDKLSPLLAPGQKTLGFMLPYTPLHYLLLEQGSDIPDVWVMTSGNISDEPIAYKDKEAMERLSKIADGFLINNREIHMRVDDSVTRVFKDLVYPIRRARAYAPNPIILDHHLPQILATGAELKNTFCLSRDNYAFVSHHIGDLENYETLNSYQEAIEHYQKLFRIKPEIIARDLHPDYLSTRYATQRAEHDNIPIVSVQHHHAHLAACLADNNWDKDEQVIGLCYDGTGYGTDGAIWGGEILVGNYEQYIRNYHLKYVPLPGGDISVKIPSRMALSYLLTNNIEWENAIPAVDSLCMEDKTVLDIQLRKAINSPMTSSMGRLFDAVSSLIGIRHRVTYEGQAAIEMEALVDPDETEWYSISFENGLIDPKSMFEEIIKDIYNSVSIPKIAARFHNSIVQVSHQICNQIRTEKNINTIALSGGVWQNKVLLENTINTLKKDRFEVLIHRNVPTNDGGISLGQTLIASKFMKNS